MPSWLHAPPLNKRHSNSGTPNNTTPPATMAAIMLRVANPTAKVASAAASRAVSVCPPVAAGQITAGAVSYTHLDVYKRQCHDAAAPGLSDQNDDALHHI